MNLITVERLEALVTWFDLSTLCCRQGISLASKPHALPFHHFPSSPAPGSHPLIYYSLTSNHTNYPETYHFHHAFRWEGRNEVGWYVAQCTYPKLLAN